VQITLLIHILAGGVAIVAGYAALAAAKGAWLHRGAGMLFVYAMLAMVLGATVLYLARGAEGQALGALLPAYFVVTALRTVRPADAAPGCPDRALALLAFVIGVGLVAMGMDALGNPGGTADGVPGGALLLNGIIALAACAGDVRWMRSGGTRGAPRLARHLWRMCFGLWMATGAFFLGQADELPAPLRIYPLLAVPAVLPLVAMAWWLWRLRGGRPLAMRVAPRGRAVSSLSLAARSVYD
jgi:hypothetical protein